MKSNIFDSIALYSSTNYEDKLLNSPEYKELVKDIIELQEDIKRLNLPPEQIEIIKNLLKENDELHLDFIEKIYKQAMIDCVVLLKELKVI